MEYYSITPTNHGWGYGYGFFSNYRICLEQLIYHYDSKDHKIPYIDWSGTTWVEGFNPFESKEIISNINPFDYWFDQSIPNYNDTVVKCSVMSDPSKFDHAKHFFNTTELKKQQLVDKKYIKVKKYILDKIDKIYEEEFKDHITLAVMARGTEYNLHHPMYGVFDIYDYIREIDNILEIKKDITKLFLVSEDMEYIDILSKTYPNSYFIPDVFRRTDETMEYINRVHCWPNVSDKRDNQCKLLGEEVIIQSKLIGKSDYLLGRLSGILAGSILWSENIKEVIQM